jgi:hypothetical protein
VLKGFPHKQVVLDQKWRYDQTTFENAHMAFIYTFYRFKSSSTISVQNKLLHIKRVVHIFKSNKRNR